MNHDARGWHKFWSVLRQLSGDDAYARYLAHWRERHAREDGNLPMDEKAFFKMEQARKWDGIKRCC